MIPQYIYSDHIDIRSDTYGTNTTNDSMVAAQAQNIDKATYRDRSGTYSWIAGGALQALRQRRMQMHAGQRAWSQILPDALPGQKQTGFHLCPAGTDRQSTRVCAQLPETTGHYQRDLRHQSGSSSAKGTVLGTAYESICLRYRHRLCCTNNCQYGRAVICCVRNGSCYQGGGQ